MKDSPFALRSVLSTLRRLPFVSGLLLILLVAACAKPSPEQSTPLPDSPTPIESLSITALPDSGGIDTINSGSDSAAPSENDLTALFFRSASTDPNTYSWTWDNTQGTFNNINRVCAYFDADSPPTGVDVVAACVRYNSSGQKNLVGATASVFDCGSTYSNGVCTTAPATTRITATCSNPGQYTNAASNNRIFAGDNDADTQGSCTIAPANTTDIPTLTLVNVCTKTTNQVPTDASADCILGNGPGLLKLVQIVNGGATLPSTFNLTYTGPQTGTIPGAIDTQAQFFPLTPGTYTLTQSTVSGYVSSLACVNSSTNAAITLTNGNQLALTSNLRATCTFTSIKTGSISVTKDAVPNDAQDFAFTTTGTGLANFSLDDDSDATLSNQKAFSNLLPGTYAVAETAVAGWTQTSANCTGDNGTPANAADDRTLQANAINLLAGEAVACTFVNSKNGSIKIVEDSVPNDPQDFAFTTTGAGLSSFSLDDDGDNANGLSDETTFNDLVAGSYTVTETAVDGWNSSVTCTDPDSGSSSSGSVATIDLDPGEAILCTYTNTPKPTTLTLVKTVVNDNGGTATAANFQASIDGNSVAWGVATPVTAGSHSASESNLAGYTAGDWGGDCAADGTVSISFGQSKTCTITNDDEAATLIVQKIVTNDNGGTLGAADFSFSVNGGSAVAFEADGENQLTVNAGTYNVTEAAASGYTASYNNCTNVVLANGGSATCTITNDDQPATLTLVKTVVNDSGGTATANDFQAAIDGTSVAWGQSVVVTVGNHTSSETNLPGYTATSWGGDCAADGSVSIALGEAKTCTITNNDNAAHLKLVKVVVNDNGGSAVATDWTLSAAGATTLSGAGGAEGDVAAGTYTLSETGPGGYTASAWSCEGGSLNGNQLNLSLGQSATCTITNDDQQATLTLVKTVVNDNGGTATPANFQASLDGNPVAWEVAIPVTPGNHSAAEATLPGYTATPWSGDCAADGTVSIALGQTKTCTIANDDVAPSLKVTKILLPTTDGGRFNLLIDGTIYKASAANNGTTGLVTLTAGTHTVTETAASGTLTNYTTTFGGACAADGTVTLGVGESKECTITNVRKARLTVTKVTQGGDGSFAFTSTNLPSPTFTMATSAGTASKTFSNVPVGVYNVAETVPAGWSLASASCNDGSPVTAIDLAPAENVVCTFTNVKAATLTIVKNATNGNGTFSFNSSTLGGFSLTTTNGTASKTFSNIAAGVYDVAETVPAGWNLTGTNCSDGSPVSAIDLTAGENVTCTFTNTKAAGNLTIQALAQGGDATFPFTSTTLGNFSLVTSAGSASRTFNNLAAGVYTIAQTVPTGWSLSSVVCSDGSPITAIDLSDGESITCTFTNVKLAKLTINKVTQGGDGSFSFSSTTLPLTTFTMATSGGSISKIFNNLAVGVHNVSENVPSGWTLAGTSCTDGSPVSAIDLSAGESVTCTFTNVKLAKLTVNKITQGGDGSFSFTSTNLPLASFTVATSGGSGSKVISNLAVGVYNVAETVPAGWILQGSSCSDGSSVDAIDLSAGESVTCTFTNLKLPKLIVTKIAQGGDGTFRFTSATLGGFSLVTSAGTKSRTFSNLAVGVYDVAETAQAGWNLTSALCSDGSPINAIDLSIGETVTCTFTNVKLTP